MEDREDNSALRAQPQTAELPHQALPASDAPSGWHVERHDLDDGRITYEVWGYIGPRYHWLFTVAEDGTGDGFDAKRVAEEVVTKRNAHDDLVAALRAVRQELWVDYCLWAGRTDTDPTRFNSKSHIRIIDDALAKAGHAPETRGEADSSNPRT